MAGCLSRDRATSSWLERDLNVASQRHRKLCEVFEVEVLFPGLDPTNLIVAQPQENCELLARKAATLP